MVASAAGQKQEAFQPRRQAGPRHFAQELRPTTPRTQMLQDAPSILRSCGLDQRLLLSSSQSDGPRWILGSSSRRMDSWPVHES
jgi:hypothetical protein